MSDSSNIVNCHKKHVKRHVLTVDWASLCMHRYTFSCEPPQTKNLGQNLTNILVLHIEQLIMFVNKKRAGMLVVASNALVL